MALSFELLNGNLRVLGKEKDVPVLVPHLVVMRTAPKMGASRNVQRRAQEGGLSMQLTNLRLRYNWRDSVANEQCKDHGSMTVCRKTGLGAAPSPSERISAREGRDKPSSIS